MNRRRFLELGAWSALSGIARAAPPPPDAAGGWLRLSSNENFLGMSPLAQQRVADAVPTSHQYPWIPRGELVEALAVRHGCQAEHVVLGAGCSEVMQMAVQLRGAPGVRLITAAPTYEDAIGYAGPLGLAHVAVPLRADMRQDIDRMREEATRAGPCIVYLCNPHNPTGTLVDAAALDAWIGSARDDVFFLIDEAYHAFAEGAAGYATARPWIDKRPSVVVTRTFSKVYAMAGLRLGYGLADPTTAAALRRLQTHHNANHLALHGALGSLADPDHVPRSLAANRAAMEGFVAVLEELGLGHVPSHANFVLHEVRGGVADYVARMRERRIWVGRPFPPLLGHCRLSLGRPEDMAVLADAMRDFRRRGWL